MVIRECLTAEECDATLDDVWRMGVGGPVDPARPETWQRLFAEKAITWQGIIGSNGTNVMTTQLLRNRQNPKVHRAWAAVNGIEELYVDHDRLGMMRPTVAVDLGDGNGPQDRPEWRSKYELCLFSMWLMGECQGKLVTCGL